MRTERDTLGEVQVPMTRSMERRRSVPSRTIPSAGCASIRCSFRAFVLLKKAGSAGEQGARRAGCGRASAIIGGCDALLDDEEQYRGQFVVDVFQAGAGTSFNMNVNEVIANLVNPERGRTSRSIQRSRQHGAVDQRCFPTAIRIATLFLLNELFPQLDALSGAFENRGEAFKDVISPAARTFRMPCR